VTALLLAALPIVLGALFAGQVAVTRTGRLRKDILANLDLLGRLPADCPNRAELEAKNGELVGVLSRRQRRRYGPFTQAGFSLGVLAGLAVAFAGFSALLASGVLPSKAASDPPTSGDYWASVGFFLFVAGVCIVAAVWSTRRRLKEHPAPAKQPAEERAS
jgi:lysylphosphatidylglycerol synthetase-like protein (DUF2156 family)